MKKKLLLQIKIVINNLWYTYKYITYIWNILQIQIYYVCNNYDVPKIVTACHLSLQLILLRFTPLVTTINPPPFYPRVLAAPPEMPASPAVSHSATLPMRRRKTSDYSHWNSQPGAYSQVHDSNHL